MDFKKRVIGYRFIRISTIAIVITSILVLVPLTYSRYESVVSSNVKTEVAYYLLDVQKISAAINIGVILPSSSPHVYNFSISNYKGLKRSEVNMEYDLKIITTTNLPFTYKLYVNEDYSNPASTNIISSENIIPDEDGVYFKHIITPTRTFDFKINKTDTYTLLIYFPDTYDQEIYQGLVENIDLIIESKQKV